MALVRSNRAGLQFRVGDCVGLCNTEMWISFETNWRCN